MNSCHHHVKYRDGLKVVFEMPFQIILLLIHICMNWYFILGFPGPIETCPNFWQIYWSFYRCLSEVWKTVVPPQASLQCVFISSKDSSYKKILRNSLSISTLSDSMPESALQSFVFHPNPNSVGVKNVFFPSNSGGSLSGILPSLGLSILSS